MAHFATPHPSVRAPRVRVPNPEKVTFYAEGGPVNGTLHKLSTTGGLATIPRQLTEGTIAEMVIKTIDGPVRGIVELLAPKIHAGAPEQAFRFIAMSDEDHERLSGVLQIMLKRGSAA